MQQVYEQEIHLHEELKVNISALGSGTLGLLVATTGLQIDTLIAIKQEYVIIEN